MSVYLQYQQEATTLLTQYGDTVIIRLASGSTIRTKGIFVSKKKTTEDSLEVAPINTTQRVCIVQGNLSKRPSIDDTLEYAKVVYNIVEVEEVSPTSTAIVYRLTVEL